MIRRGTGVYKHKLKKIVLFKKTVFDSKILYLQKNILECM